MMQITIPFNAWSKERVLDGRKICTSRTKIHGAPGDWFLVEDNRYVLIGVIPIRSHTIIENLFKAEGAKSRIELVDVLSTIFRKQGIPSSLYVHFFEAVD